MRIKDFIEHEKNPFINNPRVTEDSFKTIMNLGDKSLKLLHYLSYHSRKNRRSNLLGEDNFEVVFEIDEAVEKTCKCRSAIYVAVSELLKNDIIARTKKHYIYFIKPQFLFYGIKD